MTGVSFLRLFVCVQFFFAVSLGQPRNISLPESVIANVPLKALRNTSEIIDIPFRQYYYNESTGIKYYIAGTGSKILEIWSPYGKKADKDGVTMTIAQAAREFCYRNPSYKVIIRLRPWEDMPSAEFTACPENRTANDQCPDIIVIGTSQIIARINQNEPLDDWVLEFYERTGTSIRDDMTKGTFYDYVISSKLQAIPMVSDIRVMFFNKTTLDQINSPLPPTGHYLSTFVRGIQGNWTWDTFSDLAINVTSKTNSPALKFQDDYSEEMKLIATMFNSWGLKLFDIRSKTPYCGLSDPRFLVNFNNTIGRMKRANAVLYCTKNATDTTSNLCPADIPGFFYGTILNSQRLGVNYSNPANQLATAFVPGRTTFLGGSGLMMMNTTKDKRMTWQLLTTIVDPTKEYLTQIGLATGSPPPYDSMVNIEPWGSEEWAYARSALKNAVPIQWPSETFPQINLLENAKSRPIRQFLRDIFYNNSTMEAAADNACRYFKNVFAKSCDQSNWIVTTSTCLTNNSLQVKFSWKPEDGCAVNNTDVSNRIELPTNHVLNGSRSATRRQFISDVHLLYMLGTLVLIQTALMLVVELTYNPRTRTVTLDTKTTDQFNVSIPITQCKMTDPVALTLLCVFNFLLVLGTIVIAVLCRKAPSIFRETVFLPFIAYSAGFVAVVIFPIYMIFRDANPQFSFLLYGLTVNFATLTCTTIVCVCKIYAAYTNKSSNPSTAKHSKTFSTAQDPPNNPIVHTTMDSIPPEFYTKNFVNSQLHYDNNQLSVIEADSNESRQNSFFQRLSEVRSRLKFRENNFSFERSIDRSRNANESVQFYNQNFLERLTETESYEIESIQDGRRSNTNNIMLNYLRIPPNSLTKGSLSTPYSSVSTAYVASPVSPTDRYISGNPLSGKPLNE
ncbi:hypothetical protein HK098_000614 [Nowakowskiella sp. JEL0407]|nr:hypothetical protein HK098_000614 [Nowakowskiella sp. JEL0407]